MDQVFISYFPCDNWSFVGSDSSTEDFTDQWKVLIYDHSCRDIISPLMNVGALRNKGVTLHLLVRFFCIIILSHHDFSWTQRGSPFRMHQQYISSVPRQKISSEWFKIVHSKYKLSPLSLCTPLYLSSSIVLYIFILWQELNDLSWRILLTA